jgi:RNA polymerase sigma-70 factor (ECF subfamily)
MPSMAETPISLLEQLRHQPDEAAWRRLVELYTPLRQGWLRGYGVQRCDADDLIQEALTALFQALPGFQHNQQPGAFRRWLKVILLHRLLPFFRARKQRPTELGTEKVLQHLQELEDADSAASRQWDLEHDRQVVGRLLEMIQPEFQPTTWKAFVQLGLEGARGADVRTPVAHAPGSPQSYSL